MIPLERALAQVFATLDHVAVAVSGGVDSMTLAHLTHRVTMERGPAWFTRCHRLYRPRRRRGCVRMPTATAGRSG